MTNDKQEHDRIIADCSEKLDASPGDVSALNERGLAWESLGDYRKALADYDIAIRNDPMSAIAYHNRGNAWVYLGKLRKGIADFTRAIQLDPNSAATFTSRGVAWRRKGRYAEALADYERALEIDPHSAERCLVLGALLTCCPQRRYRDGTRALELMTEACELTDYSDAECLHYLAAAHAEQDDFHSAIAVLHKALSLDTADDDKESARFLLEVYEAGEKWRWESPTWRERWA